MLYDGGDIDQALGVLYQAVALNPTDYSPYALMGKIYASQKKYELALKSYELALDNAENAKPSELRSERVIMRDMSMIRAKLAELRKN